MTGGGIRPGVSAFRKWMKQTRRQLHEAGAAMSEAVLTQGLALLGKPRTAAQKKALLQELEGVELSLGAHFAKDVYLADPDAAPPPGGPPIAPRPPSRRPGGPLGSRRGPRSPAFEEDSGDRSRRR